MHASDLIIPINDTANPTKTGDTNKADFKKAVVTDEVKKPKAAFTAPPELPLNESAGVALANAPKQNTESKATAQPTVAESKAENIDGMSCCQLIRDPRMTKMENGAACCQGGAAGFGFWGVAIPLLGTMLMTDNWAIRGPALIITLVIFYYVSKDAHVTKIKAKQTEIDHREEMAILRTSSNNKVEQKENELTASKNELKAYKEAKEKEIQELQQAHKDAIAQLKQQHLNEMQASLIHTNKQFEQYISKAQLPMPIALNVINIEQVFKALEQHRNERNLLLRKVINELNSGKTKLKTALENIPQLVPILMREKKNGPTGSNAASPNEKLQDARLQSLKSRLQIRENLATSMTTEINSVISQEASAIQSLEEFLKIDDELFSQLKSTIGITVSLVQQLNAQVSKEATSRKSEELKTTPAEASPKTLANEGKESSHAEPSNGVTVRRESKAALSVESAANASVAAPRSGSTQLRQSFSLTLTPTLFSPSRENHSNDGNSSPTLSMVREEPEEVVLQKGEKFYLPGEIEDGKYKSQMLGATTSSI